MIDGYVCDIIHNMGTSTNPLGELAPDAGLEAVHTTTQHSIPILREALWYCVQWLRWAVA